ncbi:uncharacterized protein BYT42DRAFT_305903 [Radiomyces spectabilis]|uniref:uncharacterized protein n=1 Tax=Radiomyces spectabilis TaxID=64574 RepID=UPI00221E6CE8|nr:uncharacterized protein BYT42DRAFT_305903 [Radiomyces spectabilis]KAI8381452.1 hypothetical protein BYT42DRAFT_305903 [Radiomyces spectabilis]
MRNELCVFDVEFDMHHGSLHMHPVAQIVLEEEPSYLGYLNCCESSVIAVGTFTATLYLYTLHKQQLRAPKVIAYADGPLSIPQSAAVIGNGDISYFLLGLREGTLLAFKWHNNEKVPLFNDPPLRYHLGALPVRLTSASVPSSVYALSEYVWRIDVGSQDELVMSLVLLPKPRNMIDAITVIPHVTAHPRDHGIGTNEDHLFLSTRNEISIYKLGQTRQLHSRKLTINETPRKVVYNESLQHAVLMSTSSTTTEYKPLLRIVDLASGLPTTCRKPHNLLTDNINPDDTVLCMKEWSVHRNHKIYNYLCMGMSRSKGNQSFGDGRKLPSTQEGTLLIYRIMVDRTFRLVWMESNLPGAVHAVCPHPSGLLFSSGSLLHLFRLDPAQGR